MATDKQRNAIIIYMGENGGNSLSASMRKAGYSAKTAKNPDKLRNSKAWLELFDKAITDEELIDAHKRMLNAHTIEHMVFPLGLEEEEIRELLISAGCKPQKIKYSQTAIHVWFWSPDNATRGRAMELAYRLKGRLTNKVEVSDPDGLFGTNALSITVIDGQSDAESEATTSA